MLTRMHTRVAATAVAWCASVRIVSAAAIGSFVYLGSRRPGDGIAFTLAVMGGSLLNDVYGRHRDAVDKPWRAIPSGLIRASAAATLAASLLVASVLIFLASASHHSHAQHMLFAAAVAGVTLYNVMPRYAGMLKAPHVGALCALPVAFVLVSSRLDLLRISLATALFVCGREMLMDAIDVNGDRATGSRTVAMFLSDGWCAFTAFTLLTIGLAQLMLTIGHGLSAADISWETVSLLAVAGCAVAWISMRIPSRRRFIVYALWIPLVVQMGVLLSALSRDTLT